MPSASRRKTTWSPVPLPSNVLKPILAFSCRVGGWQYDSNQETMRDLGTLRGGYSFAMGINSAGDVVGESDGSAFLYRNGVMIDLNAALGGALGNIATAMAINDRGQIVGQVWFFDPSACGPHAFLLTPIAQ